MSFRQRLRQGDLLLGQMVLEFFTPGVGPMLASCGLDFVIFDMEHGRCDLALLAEMVASCRGSDIVPIARVPDVAAPGRAGARLHPRRPGAAGGRLRPADPARRRDRPRLRGAPGGGGGAPYVGTGE